MIRPYLVTSLLSVFRLYRSVSGHVSLAARLDRSPKGIDREGPGDSPTGTRQDSTVMTHS